MASLAAIVRYCDAELRPRAIVDYDGAVNGLQMQNRGSVTRIAAAVDASLATIRMAADQQANLLLVHHGLFWSPRHPWIGHSYELLQTLLERDLAVYSSHLPLDMHRRLGNNAQLCAALGLKRLKPFFEEKGQFLGFRAESHLSRERLAQLLERATGARALIVPGGPKVCRSIGVVTGGAGSHLRTAYQEGVDTFITGEGPHWTFAQAEELGINVLYGGHYATETFGVKALAAELSKKFRLPWVFLYHPSGL